MTRAVVGIGANLGDPVAQVRAGIAALAALPQTHRVAASSLYRTAPLGYTAQGDFVTAATSVDNESLVACLIERGTLPADANVKIGRKLPLFGRHAGAALIAHGYLQHDEIWPVLRSHAE